MTKEDRRRTLLGATYTTDQQEGIVLGRDNEVVRSGYRSAQDQIYELMRSGRQLQAAREEKYAQPTGLAPRHYGEIDITVASEKISFLKRKAIEKKQAADQPAAEQKAAEEAAKAETTKEAPKPAEKGGGVT